MFIKERKRNANTYLISNFKSTALGSCLVCLDLNSPLVLRRFERKVLRKIYGPVVNKGVRRIRYNNELCKLMEGGDIVRFTKGQRIQRLGHVERMDETAMPKRVLKGKLYATKIGRLRNRWLEDVIADLRRMEIGGWMEKASNRDQWGRIVEGAKVHPGLQR